MEHPEVDLDRFPVVGVTPSRMEAFGMNATLARSSAWAIRSSACDLNHRPFHRAWRTDGAGSWLGSSP